MTVNARLGFCMLLWIIGTVGVARAEKTKRLIVKVPTAAAPTVNSWTSGTDRFTTVQYDIGGPFIGCCLVWGETSQTYNPLSWFCDGTASDCREVDFECPCSTSPPGTVEGISVHSTTSNQPTQALFTSGGYKYVVVQAPADHCLDCAERDNSLNTTTGLCDSSEGWCTPCTITTDCSE